MYTQYLYECVWLCVSLYLGGGHQAGEEFWKGMKCQKPSSELVSPSLGHTFINYKYRSFIQDSNTKDCSQMTKGYCQTQTQSKLILNAIKRSK